MHSDIFSIVFFSALLIYLLILLYHATHLPYFSSFLHADILLVAPDLIFFAL